MKPKLDCNLDPPTSASQVLELAVCSTTTEIPIFFEKHSTLFHVSLCIVHDTLGPMSPSDGPIDQTFPTFLSQRILITILPSAAI
jgi:hypothetical protein